MRLLFLFFLIPLMGIAQNKLTVKVSGVSSNSGNIMLAVYDNAEGFLKEDKALMGVSTRAVSGITELQISELPEGQYALAIYHDENGNEELDTNWLGIPKEPIGFSNSKMKTFGPPGFEDCSFLLKADKEIQISL
ncbi:DUF2141 domain-containing protein [Lentiprolixibacter aurantiacus]|uniref:DUF2141 domain-containing protein n=1 Tax=Lentiprolixibacter aurantiacus TaxID=2993939 RepID=A0AAE3MJT5_9FLAO|nr:DUF2141 domain-containing protein [Lentiprolixibacter aurantiacus]MCX2718744.1 DUF2141 domain-containing protein [Lentiprolixibacter aurantiacus]